MKKDLTTKLENASRSVADSTLMKNLISPIIKSDKAPRTYVKVIDVNDSLGAFLGDTGHKWKIHLDTVHGQELSTEVNINNKGADVMMEGVRMIIRSTSGLPDSISKLLTGGNDTASLRRSFELELKKMGWQFSTRWQPDSAKHQQRLLYLKGIMSAENVSLEVGGFRSYLLGKMLPQVFFALLLISLTGVAFLFTFRSLKQQMRLSKLKNDFISNMSHELKTPVSTVKVALEALNEAQVLDDKTTARDYITMAALEIERLELLINQALNTSLLEDGKIILQKERLDIKLLTEGVLHSMRLRFAQQQVKLVTEFTGADFTVMADKLHMQGVLLNILDNALKYGSIGGEIKVAVKQDPGSVNIEITDNGPGIPKEYLDKVFDKFFRVPTGDTHNVKGYGLGLSYAAQVMKQHSGFIYVQNNPGGGCTFTVTLLKS